MGLVLPGLLVLGMMLTAAPVLAADRPPGGNFTDPAVYAVDVAQPAIVRVVTLYSGHITFNLCGSHVTLPSSGKNYEFGQSGSGAFVSSSGDILTADHVVNVDQYAVFEDPTSAQDIADLLNTNPGCHLTTPVTATDIANGFVQAVNIPYSSSYSKPKRLIWLATSYTGPDSSSSTQQVLDALMPVSHQTATVVAQSSTDQNDLAILHVNLTNTPSITLGDSTQVAVQDPLTLIGFPGNGDSSHVADQTVDATDLLTPSVNSVMVSAMKSSSNGSTLIQVGGNVEHGDSGGPVLDSKGRIVGIVSFGGVDPRGNTTFLRASDDARTLLAHTSINTSPGVFERQWESAFADYAASYSGHWHKAASELRTLHLQYPTFAGITPYLDYAQRAAAREPLPIAGPGGNLVEVAALAALALLLLILLLLASSRRRRREQAALAMQAVPAQLPYGQFPGYPDYSGYPPVYPPVPPTPVQPVTPQPPHWQSPSGAQAMPSTPYGGQGAPSHPEAVHASPGSYPPAQTSGAGASAASWNMPSYGTPVQPRSGINPASGTGSGEMWQTQRSQPDPVSMAYEATPHAQQASSGRCYAGHPMRASEIYCATCGMPRMPDTPGNGRDTRSGTE